MKRILVLIATILAVFSTLSIAVSTTARIKATAPAAGSQDPAGADSAQSRQLRPLEDFDIRANLARSLPTQEDQSRAQIRLPSHATGARGSRLLRERPNALIQLSSLTGTPSRIFGLRRPLSEARESDAEVTARRFLKTNRDLFRLSDSEVDALKVARRYRTVANRVTRLLLLQQVNEIEVFQGEYAVHVDGDGAVVAASGELMPEASKTINLVLPRLSSFESLRKGAQYAGVEIKGALRLRKQATGANQHQIFRNEDGAEVFARDVEARLVYFPLSPDQMRLAWEFALWRRETPDTYLILVDAERGSLLYRYNMTWRCFDRTIANSVPLVQESPNSVPEGQRILAGGKTTGERVHSIRALEGRRTEATSVALSGLDALWSLAPRWFYHPLISAAPPAQYHLEMRTQNHFANSINTSGFYQTAQTPHGLVFTKDSPRPDLPHTSDNPAIVDREDVPFRPSPFNGAVIFSSTDPHNDWWAGQPATGLISNNVDTRLDRDNNNLPDQPRLTVADGNFSFPIDFTQPPTAENNQKAAQVNLFYWVNRYHDILYAFGFDEASGNFQTNNFGRGGLGADPILADAQEGGGVNNANFSAPPDGTPGRVQMYLWTTANPQLDGAFDQGVIIHELTHGLSSRLVGDGAGLAGMQSRGMGEGWSDYFGIVLMRGAGDDLDGTYPVGQYVANNYARGIRRFPYSSDPQVYPFNFGDIARSAEAHNVGEIWCDTLLEMRAQLIRKHGFREGQRQSIQLVVDGLKLTPVAPTFLDARNAIMLADRLNNGGANQCAIWQAFSKHGMGFSASTIDSGDTAPVESFDAPPSCSDVGSIRFDQKNYLAGEMMRISVGDRNAPTTPGAVKVVAQSSVTKDQETITLTQDSVFNGLFSGGIRVVAGRANPGDGSLQVSLQAGDKIIVSYTDTNAVVSSQADVVGEAIILEDNVEAGNKGWIASGTPVPTWAITSARYASKSHAWTDSPAGNYANNSDNSLVSPLLDLSRAAGVVLSFAHSYELETGFDYGVVEYSTDDGVTWKRAAAFTGSQSSFTQARVKLDGLIAASRARIRFRLQSDAAVTRDGWTIDDIRVIARSPDLTYLPSPSALAPSIAAVTPAFGAPIGNTPVTISGLNFTETADVKVFFDDQPASNVRVIGASVIAANTPPHSAGAVTLRVETRYGVAPLANAFTYFVQDSVSGAPELSNIFPTSGASVGRTAVTIYGSNFTPQTAVAFGDQNAVVTFINSNALRVVTPASPNNATGAVDVKASNPRSAPARLTAAFNYVAPTPPTVKVLAPNGGETFFAGGVITLRWQSSDNRAVAGHRIALTTPGLATSISDEVAGEAQSFNWTIPITISPTTSARIRVVAVDDEGVETEAFSSGDFTIDRRWAQSTQLPVGLNRLAVTSAGQYLYAIGGRSTTNNSTAVATLQRLDPSAGSPAWSSDGLAPLPIELNAIKAATIQGKIYVPGGFTRQATIDRNTRIYDIAGNSWSAQAPPPTGVGNYAMAAGAGVLYVTGGNDLNSAVSNFQAYDTVANTWRELPPMKTARLAHEAALINGKLYVVGGAGAYGGLADGEVFDFQTNQWSPIASLNQPRFYAVSAIARNESGELFWLVFGGADPNTAAPLGSAEAYDVANNRWIALDGSFALPSARTSASGAVHNGFLYAVGGSITGPNSVADNERFKLDGFTLINPNQPPVVVIPTGQQIAIPNQELKFTVSAQDLGSGAPITISAEGLPNGAVFNTANDTNNSARGEFRWTPQPSDVGRGITVDFTASDGMLTDVKSVVIRVVSAGVLTPVNAADFRVGPLAADSIAAAFGSNLAYRVEAAQTLPLPTSLSGTTLTVNGVPAPLLFVSPGQINFIVPPTVDQGPAVIIASGPMGTYSVGNVQIVAAAPAIFTADSSGAGDAAALATIDGVNFQTQPFDVIVNGKPNILVLFGTGIRRAPAANPNDGNGVAESVNITIGGRNAIVLYAGAQSPFGGLDQINVEMPPELANTGPRSVDVIVTVSGVPANRVTIRIR
ncbi:MAG TPA: M36 family metallopeptidase [Blastocatellia bacterium]|nr:M36 family metallopeptidase [Blastocatellia bacterium]